DVDRRTGDCAGDGAAIQHHGCGRACARADEPLLKHGVATAREGDGAYRARDPFSNLHSCKPFFLCSVSAPKNATAPFKATGKPDREAKWAKLRRSGPQD